MQGHVSQDIANHLRFLIIISSIRQTSVLCLRKIIIILDIFVTIVIIILNKTPIFMMIKKQMIICGYCLSAKIILVYRPESKHSSSQKHRQDHLRDLSRRLFREETSPIVPGEHCGWPEHDVGGGDINRDAINIAMVIDHHDNNGADGTDDPPPSPPTSQYVKI